jgi:hypothetical protein
MKPLGYYTNYTPGDGGLLGEMERDWGSDFSALSESQRFWLLHLIAQNLFNSHPESDAEFDNDDDVVNALERFDEELSRGDQIGLMSFLLNTF